MMRSFSTLETRQPWWVQTALKALNVPWLGWVITTAGFDTIVPPPTGTSAAFTSALVAASEPDCVVELLPPPQAARAAAAPTAAAPDRTARRLNAVVVITRCLTTQLTRGWTPPGQTL